MRVTLALGLPVLCSHFGLISGSLVTTCPTVIETDVSLRAPLFLSLLILGEARAIADLGRSKLSF